MVIADKDLPTTIGVRLALEQDGFVISAEEKTCEGVVAAAVRDAPDICLVDVHVPGGGIEAAAAIRSRLPQTHVVVLTAAVNDDHLFAALEAGASGYLLKEMSAARLAAALRGVLRGEAALPRMLTGRLMREFRARAIRTERGLVRRGKNELTEREWEVLDCLGEGLSTRGIAERLFISQTTVRRHVGSILAKLKVPDRAAAVELAAKRSQNLNAHEPA